MAAVIGMQRAQDLVAFKFLSGLQQWRGGQGFGAGHNIACIPRGQCLDAHNLHGQVIGAAVVIGRFDDQVRGLVRIIGVVTDQAADGFGADVFIHTIRGQHEHIPHIQRQGAVIHIHRLRHTDGTRQIALGAGNNGAVILGQLFQTVALQPVNPAVADVEQMCHMRFQHKCGKGADIAAIHVMGMDAAFGIGKQPRIGRPDHPQGRGFYRPCLRGAVVIGQKAFGHAFSGNTADFGRTDPVGDHHGNAFQRQGRLNRGQGAKEILIDFLAPCFGTLSKGYG